MAKKVNLQAAMEANNSSLLNETSQSMAIQTDQIYWQIISLVNKKKLAAYGGEVFCFMSDEDVAETAKKNVYDR